MSKQKTIAQLLGDISKKVEEFLYDERMTYNQLAEKAGVSTVLLAQIKKNDLENISLKKLIQVANAIGFNIEVTLDPIKKK